MKNDFNLFNKTEIYYNQFCKRYLNLETLNIPYLNTHIYNAKIVNNKGGMIICPFCINCYIHPGANVLKELNIKYGLLIDNDCNLFDNIYFRPGVCDYIKQHPQGTNTLNNGIYICSQCQKLRNNLSISDFFKNYFITDKHRYYKRPDIKYNIIEVMNLDNFKNKCLKCNSNSDYKICSNCAGKRDELIYIAN